MKVVWHFPFVDGAQVLGTWNWLLKQSKTGPYVLEGCLLRDLTMKRVVSSEELADMAYARLRRQQGWQEALSKNTIPWSKKRGLWWLPLPSGYLDSLREDTHSFRVRSGGSAIDIKPILVAWADLVEILGEEEAAKAYTAYEREYEEVDEVCIVGDTIHFLSRLEDLSRIAKLLDEPWRVRASLPT